MDNRRIFLWAGLLFVYFVVYQTWVREQRGPQQVPTAEIAADAPAIPGEVAPGDADLPALPDSEAAAAPQDLPAFSATSALEGTLPAADISGRLVFIGISATGAGDQFAAGFLYGFVPGQTLAVAGRMGCIAAAEVISHYGARPETDLKALFRKEGVL